VPTLSQRRGHPTIQSRGINESPSDDLTARVTGRWHLIPVMPRLLTYFVAVYLIIIGLLGLFGSGNFHLQ
jgi:hypothetical protein